MVPASQAVCSSLLEECFEIAQEIRAQDDSRYVASSLRPIYDRLSAIRRELEQLVGLRDLACLHTGSDALANEGLDTSVEPPRDGSMEL